MNQYYGYLSKENKVHLTMLTSMFEYKLFQKMDNSFVEQFIPIFRAKNHKDAVKIAEKEYIGGNKCL